MTTTIEQSTVTVTSWNNPEIYDKRKRDIAATVLKALAGSVIDPSYVETWDEIVNGTIIHYTMSRSDIVKNFGFVFFDKLGNKKSLTNTTAQEEVKAPVAENPLAYLLPLLDSPPSDNTPPKQTPIEDTDALYLLMGASEKPSPKQRIEPSNEEVANAFAWYAEISPKEAPAPVSRVSKAANEVSDLLELLSL